DRALNHRGRINPEVAERILDIANEMGYVPRNKNVKRLRIGVITQLAKYSFMDEINRGIKAAKRELRSRHVEVIVAEGLSVNEDEQLKAIDKLVRQDIDALAIMPVDDEKIRTRLNHISEEKKIPVITFNTDIFGTGRMLFVGMDNTKSGKTAAGLMGMLTRGTGRILVITGFFGSRINNMRVEGFVEEIKSSFPGMEIAGVQSCFDDAEELKKIIVNAMLGGQNITGILVVSAGQSGLVEAFEELQLEKRPYVITYDLTPWSKQALKNDQIDFLIDQEGFRQGYRAVTVLSNILLNKQTPSEEYEYTDINIKTKYNI
ncbi:MAG TPA: LacI family transcriptional regulator, partial [Lachnospiraceae bacterium]|nr:LacI family transcriptional regulator [Lachnospiraceae bacterium]